MNLILFFNGWGIDRSCVSEIKIPINFCLQVVNFPYDYDVKNLEKYEKVYFAGWSFGAWYLSKFIIENEIKSQNVIGINGHGEIIGKYGIKEKMIDFTIKNLTEKSILKFYKNMGMTDEPKISQGKIFSIKNELIYFRKNYVPSKNVFQKIIIGKKDKIIPFKNQKKYCCENNIKCIEKDFYHFPFENIKDWNEIIGERE